MNQELLIIRTRDRAMFEAGCLFALGAGVRRLQWIERRWWFSGLEPTGEYWTPHDDAEFELVNRRWVVEGCKELNRR